MYTRTHSARNKVGRLCRRGSRLDGWEDRRERKGTCVLSTWCPVQWREAGLQDGTYSGGHQVSGDNGVNVAHSCLRLWDCTCCVHSVASFPGLDPDPAGWRPRNNCLRTAAWEGGCTSCVHYTIRTCDYPEWTWLVNWPIVGSCKVSNKGCLVLCRYGNHTRHLFSYTYNILVVYRGYTSCSLNMQDCLLDILTFLGYNTGKIHFHI